MSDACRCRWPYLVLACILAAVLAVTWVIRSGGERIEGQTVQERIERIGQLAADRPDGAGEAIAAAATEDPHALVRQTALKALAQFQDARFRPAVEAGTRDVTPYARAAAARTLTGYGDDGAAVILGRLGSEDPTEGVRMDAIVGLEQIATPTAVALLVTAAEHNEFPSVRRAALAALTRLLESHQASWEAARWEALDAEVNRVAPLATRPDPATTRPHEHGQQQETPTTRSRPAS